MASLTQSFEQRQQQTLSPRLQRAVRLLQLSSMDFAQEVNEMLDQNPFLESDDDAPDGVAADMPGQYADGYVATDDFRPASGLDGATPGADEIVLAEPSNAADAVAETAGHFDDFGSDEAPWLTDGSSKRRRDDDDGLRCLDLQSVEYSLADHLLRQLNVQALSARDNALAQAVIGSLDDDGYLRVDLSELGELPDMVDLADLESPPDDEELRIALSRVQALDPAGIGARSVQECLLLQLGTIVGDDEHALAQAIVARYLPLLAARDVPGLARALGRSVPEIDAALRRIRRLDPRPGWRFGASNVQYVTPDVIVRKVHGAWTTTLNPAVVPRVRLNRVYAEMFQRSRNAQHGELSVHLAEARWTVSNVEQRFATILSVAQAIVRHQQLFLEYGPLAMKPLGLREIADEVGVHESTVSRVTNNKFMSTPLGVFELKYFFSRVMNTANGGECSATAIRGLIRDMIADESPADPLSDAEIARLLARQGIIVARRTVTKYRQLLHIEAFEGRRRYA
ncbi:MAG: RNA polymerase factor sigma-54 [Propionivibrio sp.]